MYEGRRRPVVPAYPRLLTEIAISHVNDDASSEMCQLVTHTISLDVVDRSLLLTTPRSTRSNTTYGRKFIE